MTACSIANKIRKIKQPLVVIHGPSDEAIPFAHGQRLFTEHRGPKMFLEIPGAGHNNIWIMGQWKMMTAIKGAADLTEH